MPLFGRHIWIKIMFCFASLFFSLEVWSQSVSPFVISSAAGQSTSGSVQLNSNAGELVVSTLSAGGLLFTQGFLQPEIYTVSVPEENQIAISVFPNPFTDFFTIALNGMHQGFFFQLTDLSGKIIKTETILSNSNSAFVDLPELSSGYYFLQLTPLNQGQVLHFKLVHL